MSAVGAVALGVALAGVCGGAATTQGAAAVSQANKAAAEAQFDKANALYKQDKYAEAQVENDKALKLDPTNTNAQLMKRVLEAKVGAGSLGATSQGEGTVAAAGERVPTLTPQQITVVKLMELGARDRAVSGRVEPKVLEDFWQNVVLKDPIADKTPAAKTAFMNPGNLAGQLQRIRETPSSKYKEQVTITSEPAAYLAYKNNVQTFVLTNCATGECHGERAPAAASGNFRLANPANAAAEAYTNFYILSQYANKDGQMVDRVNPEKSLLVQYAQPWAVAAVKHPKVDVKKVAGPNDARLRPIVEWIRGINFPKPVYGISYNVPGMELAATASAPASAPASGPASAPASAPATGTKPANAPAAGKRGK
jgi:hypothetical protein